MSKYKTIFGRILNVLTAVIAGSFAAKVFILLIKYVKEIWYIEKTVAIQETCCDRWNFDFNRFTTFYIVFVAICVIILLISCCHECSHKLETHGNRQVLEEEECAYEKLK